MTIFFKIINGELPSFKIYENEKFFAFLDINPIVKGHTLIVPKIDVDKLYLLPDVFLSEILLFSRSIAKAIESTFPCERCGYSVVGLDIPHAHLHLLPINNISDMDFSKPKLKLDTEELEEIQNKLVKSLEEFI